MMFFQQVATDGELEKESCLYTSCVRGSGQFINSLGVPNGNWSSCYPQAQSSYPNPNHHTQSQLLNWDMQVHNTITHMAQKKQKRSIW
ncbi:hypothetical protein AVEN_6486-1 [Araneus ventricosus]|uniref:Uncharacterized protein n=1 Tax=Araneus ventricosus TaxID=182803 RepID=A0A4Y2HAA4_ARAVE|nr:hypothetical protein AVEN_6486-1 [Araneus ventricosus]